MIDIPGTAKILINTGLISSGKSTMINAFAGKDILETSNLICTSRICLVADFQTSALRTDPQQGTANEKDRISFDDSTVVAAEMPRISRKTLNVAIIDTPGVNDALGSSAREVAFDTIRHIKDGTIVYVSNPQNCGTEDDAGCMLNMAEIIRSRQDQKWFAVLNGWDMTSPKEDNPEAYHEKIRSMTKRYRISEPEFFYVSSLGAALARKALSKQQMTDAEQVNLTRIMRFYQLGSKLPDWWDDDRSIGNKALRTVVYRSGIPKLEDALYRYFLGQK